MTSFRLALLNLLRRKVPSLIAVFAIAISVACSGVLYRTNLVLADRFSALGQAGEALVGAKAGGIEILLGALDGEGAYPGFLPYSLFQSLRTSSTVHFEDGIESRPKYIREIIPFVYFGRAGQFRIVGTDESFIHRTVPRDSLSFQSGGWATGPQEAVVGARVAQAENLRPGDTITADSWTGNSGSGRRMFLRVTGVLQETRSAWDRMIFSNLPTAQAALAQADLGDQSIWGASVLNYFLVYLEPGGFPALASLVNRRTVGQAVLVSEEQTKLQELTGTGRKLGLAVTALILVLGTLSVTAMLITRFEAMSLQLAVLRAIGYKKRGLGGWLLWEGFLLGLCACLLGALLDAVTFPLLREMLGSTLPPPEIVGSSVWQSYPIWISALAATVASVFIPLYRVYHQDVHFSLRA